MKIGVISSQVFAIGTIPGQALPGYGGLEVVAWECARGLAAKGHEVFLIAPEGSSCPGTTLIPSGPPGQWDERRGYETYWKRLTEMECLIDHSWGKWPLIGKQEGWLKIPSLSVCHAPVDTMFQSMPPVDKPCFVCISQDQADHFRALFSRDCRYVHNGCDTLFYQSLGTPRSDRYLFLARFSTIKGPDLAIEACRRAGVGLDLVGDTSITNEPEYLEQCKRLCDGKQIRLLGPCSRGESVFHFSQARALLHLNQRFREPLGLAPLEAQLCGCPVLAWNLGAMRETVEPGKTGYLVTSLDEAVAILQNGQLDRLDRNYCRQWALKFDLQHMVDGYDTLCSEAVATGGW